MVAKTKTPKTKSTSKTKKEVTPSKERQAPAAEVAVCRRRGDRRQASASPEPQSTEAPPATLPLRPERRKVPRRRQIDPTTCERDYTTDEIEFMHALDAYKRSSGRMFPTCSEILEVVRGLGYSRPTSEPASTAGTEGTDEAASGE